MLCLEDTYFSMAEKMTTGQNALVICDRGTMDASAFISPQASLKNIWIWSLFSDLVPTWVDQSQMATDNLGLGTNECGIFIYQDV